MILDVPTYAAFFIPDLFSKFDIKRLHLTCKQIMAMTFKGEKHKKRLMCSIFHQCVRMVLDDIISNNATFHLPLTSFNKAEMKMSAVTGTGLAKLRKYDNWKGTDLLTTGFKDYHIKLFLWRNGLTKDRVVYITKKDRKRIVEKLNSGFVYGDSINDTTVDDYLDRLHERYPLIIMKELKMILVYGWRQVYNLVHYGCDVCSRSGESSMYIGHLRGDNDHIRYQKYFRNKLKRKMRVKYRRSKLDFGNYYYFHITDEEYQKIKDQKGPIDFGYVTIYKLKDEAKLRMEVGDHLYQIPFIGGFFALLNVRVYTDDAVEILQGTEDNLKILKKNYELI